MPNLKYIFVFVFAFLIKEMQGQVYPVQGTAGLIPPYALRLSDYTTSSSERFTLNVLLADVTKADLHVRFRISITGQNVKLETKPEYIGSIITMQGGVPLRLTNVELAEYFDPNHLNFSGISKADFLKTGILPEGFYQFCFEVIEYNRGVQISNSICAPAWLILNDPPLINLPLSGTKLKPLFPQNVMLQWTPRHTGSPNAAFTTEYEVKVVEVWPANRNPNDAILSQPAIYETTTNSTSLVYGPDATQLEAGRTYAFRVQAKAMTGSETLDLFKNNGYSETAYFIYGDACDPPVNIVAQAETPSRVSLQWDASPSQTGYTVHYRTKGQSDANWYSTTSLITSAEISDLQPNTTYEYEVMSTCGSFESTFGNIATITTPDLSQKGYSCGVTPPDFNLDPSQLLPILKVGDKVNAGDFDVTITKVSGANGAFSGEGAVVVPFLNQVRGRVAFENITVNSDKRMVNGFMNVTGGGIEIVPSGVMSMMDQLSQGLDVAQQALDSLAKLFPPKPDPATFVANEEIKISEGIAKVFKDPISGNVIVVDNKGNTQSIPPGKDVVVTDSKGNGALVNSQGGVTNTTAAQAVACTKRELILNVTFAKASDTKNGFDEMKINDLAKNYNKLGENYYVAWKAVPTSMGDRVAAKYNGKDLKLDMIKFDQDGTPLEATITGTSIEFTAYSVAEGVTSSLVAHYTPADTAKKEQILGKLNVVGYEDKPFTVHIVPVNGVVSPADKAAIESKLKEVYSQAVVSWTVAMEKNFQVSGLSSPFDNGSSGLLSNYTKDMRTVINSYSDSNPLQEDDYYLFLVPPGTNAGQDGFMPRSKQCGFIFMLNNSSAVSVARAIAHELGHGAFTLKHTFDQYSALKGVKTDNLMDYNEGISLWKTQWDQIHDPVTVLGLFESDAAGASVKTDEDVVGYVISNADARVRLTTPPNDFKVPKEILPKGQEIRLISSTAQGEFSIIKFLDKDQVYVTSTSNISKIIKLSKPAKLLIINTEECVTLPYSDSRTGHTPDKDSYVFADKICGDFYQIKEDATSNQGWWISKNSIKRVGDDVSDNFDWMTKVAISDPIEKEVLETIEKNLKDVNDKTDSDIYGKNYILKYGDKANGFYYRGVDTGTPEFPGETEFVKSVKKVIYDELAKEGNYGSINTYDNEVFTWGKGFAVTGKLMDVIQELFKIKNPNYQQIFLNVGVQVVNKHFWVLDKNGSWLKDVPTDAKDQYKASEYIKSNPKLLSFFTELAEKNDYKQDVMNSQKNVIMLNKGAGDFPEYILNDKKTGYSSNWNNTSVTVLSHLSFWCGHSWSEGTDRYKDTNGELDKILYKYIYNTARTYPATRIGVALETNIYRWDSSLNIIGLLNQIGDPVKIGLSTLEETWSLNLIDVEYKTDKLGKQRAVKKNTGDFLSNSECVILSKSGSFLIVTKDAEAIVYQKFDE